MNKIVLKRYFSTSKKEGLSAETFFAPKVLAVYKFTQASEFFKKIRKYEQNKELSECIEWHLYEKKTGLMFAKHELLQRLSLTKQERLFIPKRSTVSKTKPKYKEKDIISVYSELSDNKEIYLGEATVLQVNRIYCTETYIRLYSTDDEGLDNPVKEIKVGNNKVFRAFCNSEGYKPEKFIKQFCKKRYKGFYTKFALNK